MPNNPFINSQQDGLMDALRTFLEEPVPVWRGLLSGLMGQSMISPSAGPEDLSPLSAGAISKYVPLYRGEVLPRTQIWQEGSPLRKFVGSWYSSQPDTAQSFAQSGGYGERGRLLRVMVPEHMLPKFSSKRLSPDMRSALLDAPDEAAYILPKWLQNMAETMEGRWP